ncbi:EAL domain-containing protein [Oscillochloris sp. ZM17-4]|uniref:EAL domain-containing response regulator n=1 Tax=Oscillochloris sp. ZM17-4 TaxID=2866714 RepID=UPI001C731485|nr:EAL domain-containing protein [Oscillochloris sp. ZM17-4]MBX0330998.1 EAL domain-containing protein [Oscillochloris sp. ZM17-4]
MEPGHILVIDDQELIRNLIIRQLTRQSHEVIGVGSGAEGLALLRAQPFDLLLLDMIMPDMDGRAVLTEIKADPQLPDLPVVVLSGDTDIEIVVACITLGAEDYLFKPFNPLLLKARVSVSLAKKHLRDQERRQRADLERQVAERAAALERSEERYALAARGANDGLWDWDLLSDRVFLSSRWKNMLGYNDAEIGDAPAEWLDRIHPDDQELFTVRLTAHFRQLLSYFEHEYRIRHRSGAYRWVLCRGMAVWDASGRATRIAGSQTDITERRAAEEQMQYDALHDLLTGLPNRALFLDRLDRAIAIARRQPERRFAVLFLDLDRFKTINDSLGHAAGDYLLTTIAQRIQACLRPNDTVARLGGDEFTILIEDVVDDQTVELITQRLQAAIAEPIMLGDHQSITTASIGITGSSLEYSSSAEMIRDADTAMYQAKMGGRARHSIFTPLMHVDAMAKLQLEGDLRMAMARGELLLHYQPIISLVSGRVSGFESLIRWQHPQRGLLYPGTFLDIAEETSLIIPITWWVLREACRQAYIWQREFPTEPPLSVNVNLSARIFTEPDVVAQIADALVESGLPPTSLKLELTEHSLIALSGDLSDTLQRIRDLGVQLCIDDFGTGYSSLSYLYNFPVNVLKIDRSFISRLSPPSGQSEIVQAIIALARTLNLDVVAEGIETEEQYQQLRNLQCGLGQGWLFAPGLDDVGVRALLAGA